MAIVTNLGTLWKYTSVIDKSEQIKAKLDKIISADLTQDHINIKV